MLFVGAVFGFFAILIVGLTIVQFRSITPNAYRCVCCGAEFRRPAHQDFPASCPSCGKSNWATNLPVE